MNYIIKILLEVLWLMLPAYGSNIAPNLFRNSLKFMAGPVDMGMSWKGKRLLGDNKTFRGFVVGIASAILLTFLQANLYTHPFVKSISVVDYSKINPAVFGAMVGFGALFGDAVKSFFKRRLGIRSGERWFPFDNIDWTIGSLAFMSLYYSPDLLHLVVILALFPILHIFVNYVAFHFKLKERKW